MARGARREAERFQSKIEISTGTTVVKVEFRSGLSVSDVELDQLKQALETASTGLFGEPSRSKALPVHGTDLAR